MTVSRLSMPVAWCRGISHVREVPTPRRSGMAKVSVHRLLTVAEAAHYAHVCPETIYRAIRSEALIASRAGRALRIDPEDLRTWLTRSEGGRVRSRQVRRMPVRRQRTPMADALRRHPAAGRTSGKR